MRMPVRLFFVFLAGIGIARGASTERTENQPVEITSTGGTTYENGLATARDNVAIHIGDTDIYSDHATYNSKTHEITADRNVRIYRDVSLYIAEHAVYNLDTKQVRTGKMRTEYQPYFLNGQSVVQTSQNAYQIQDANFTTHDTPESNSDFHLHARPFGFTKTITLSFTTSHFMSATFPIFWWPYIYQSLNDAL